MVSLLLTAAPFQNLEKDVQLVGSHGPNVSGGHSGCHGDLQD
jgi:hypothetical protein